MNCEPCEDVEPSGDTSVMTDKAPSSSHNKSREVISVEDISPLPKITAAPGARKRMPEKSKVLTSTPVKLEIEEMLKKKTNKSRSQNKNRSVGSKDSKKNVRVVKRKLSLEVPDHEVNGDDVYECIYCADKFVDPPPEPWAQCSVCLNWCHEACVLHMKPPFPANFACANCLPKRKRR